jgi:transketolase
MRDAPLLSSTNVRKVILQQSKRANIGHIGSCLSIAEILVALYAHVLNIPSPSDPERDRFILSKGHAALTLYATLFLRGLISQEILNTFCCDGSVLGVHPEHVVPGIDFSSGSLGQGLSFGTGAALAARLQSSSRRVFVLVSDAECNEGALWEAVMFAAHHQLANLVAIIDANGQQALGYTCDVLALSPLSERWRAFGWDVCEVDGHDILAMADVFSHLNMTSGAPHAVIAHTTFGKGVSYMEGQIKWHYMPMSDDEYRQALLEIGAEA